MNYFVNEFGMIVSHPGYPDNPDATALVQQPQWSGVTTWAIAWTNDAGERKYIGDYPTMLAAYKAAKRKGVWR